jgi:hypothetical protein
MDWLLTIDLEESVIEKIDKTAKRSGKTRMEVANEIIEHILKNLEVEKSNQKTDRQSSIFNDLESDINH